MYVVTRRIRPKTKVFSYTGRNKFDNRTDLDIPLKTITRRSDVDETLVYSLEYKEEAPA